MALPSPGHFSKAYSSVSSRRPTRLDELEDGSEGYLSPSRARLEGDLPAELRSRPKIARTPPSTSSSFHYAEGSMVESESEDDYGDDDGYSHRMLDSIDSEGMAAAYGDTHTASPESSVMRSSAKIIVGKAVEEELERRKAARWSASAAAAGSSRGSGSHAGTPTGGGSGSFTFEEGGMGRSGGIWGEEHSEGEEELDDAGDGVMEAADSAVDDAEDADGDDTRAARWRPQPSRVWGDTEAEDIVYSSPPGRTAVGSRSGWSTLPSYDEFMRSSSDLSLDAAAAPSTAAAAAAAAAAAVAAAAASASAAAPASATPSAEAAVAAGDGAAAIVDGMNDELQLARYREAAVERERLRARSRKLRTREEKRALLAAVEERMTGRQRRLSAILTIQRFARGWLARHRLRMEQAQARRLAEESFERPLSPARYSPARASPRGRRAERSPIRTRMFDDDGGTHGADGDALLGEEADDAAAAADDDAYRRYHRHRHHYAVGADDAEGDGGDADGAMADDDRYRHRHRRHDDDDDDDDYHHDDYRYHDDDYRHRDDGYRHDDRHDGADGRRWRRADSDDRWAARRWGDAAEMDAIAASPATPSFDDMPVGSPSPVLHPAASAGGVSWDISRDTPAELLLPPDALAAVVLPPPARSAMRAVLLAHRVRRLMRSPRVQTMRREISDTSEFLASLHAEGDGSSALARQLATQLAAKREELSSLFGTKDAIAAAVAAEARKATVKKAVRVGSRARREAIAVTVTESTGALEDVHIAIALRLGRASHSCHVGEQVIIHWSGSVDVALAVSVSDDSGLLAEGSVPLSVLSGKESTEVAISLDSELGPAVLRALLRRRKLPQRKPKTAAASKRGAAGSSSSSSSSSSSASPAKRRTKKRRKKRRPRSPASPATPPMAGSPATPASMGGEDDRIDERGSGEEEEEEEEAAEAERRFSYLKRKKKKVPMAKVDWSHVKPRTSCRLEPGKSTATGKGKSKGKGKGKSKRSPAPRKKIKFHKLDYSNVKPRVDNRRPKSPPPVKERPVTTVKTTKIVLGPDGPRAVGADGRPGSRIPPPSSARRGSGDGAPPAAAAVAAAAAAAAPSPVRRPKKGRSRLRQPSVATGGSGSSSGVGSAGAGAADALPAVIWPWQMQLHHVRSAMASLPMKRTADCFKRDAASQLPQLGLDSRFFAEYDDATYPTLLSVLRDEYRDLQSQKAASAAGDMAEAESPPPPPPPPADQLRE